MCFLCTAICKSFYIVNASTIFSRLDGSVVLKPLTWCVVIVDAVKCKVELVMLSSSPAIATPNTQFPN